MKRYKHSCVNMYQLPTVIILSNGRFWSPARAGFLREARESDSGWSEVVDALNVARRATDKSE
ncbi:MAG: DUF2789 family protein [Pseudomonadota bacterium]|nr:DUF2789 family protein [Pseudomonadota bacterium]